MEEKDKFNNKMEKKDKFKNKKFKHKKFSHPKKDEKKKVKKMDTMKENINKLTSRYEEIDTKTIKTFRSVPQSFCLQNVYYGLLTTFYIFCVLFLVSLISNILLFYLVSFL